MSARARRRRRRRRCRSTSISISLRAHRVMAVLADRLDGARLRPLVACFFGEPTLRADAELVDPADHAVAMEIDLAAVVGLELPPLAFDVEKRHARVLRLGVRLD